MTANALPIDVTIGIVGAGKVETVTTPVDRLGIDRNGARIESMAWSLTAA